MIPLGSLSVHGLYVLSSHPVVTVPWATEQQALPFFVKAFWMPVTFRLRPVRGGKASVSSSRASQLNAQGQPGTRGPGGLQ